MIGKDDLSAHNFIFFIRHGFTGEKSFQVLHYREEIFRTVPAVVHDYLYWQQTCTRDQSDQILLLGMIENKVPAAQRTAIYLAVRAARGLPGKPTEKVRPQGYFLSAFAVGRDRPSPLKPIAAQRHK